MEETRTIEAMAIEEEELEEGFEVTFLEPSDAEMDITVTGDEELLRDLSRDDFRIIVNLDGLDEGEHQVPVTIDWEEIDDVTVTPEFEEVTVEIE